MYYQRKSIIIRIKSERNLFTVKGGQSLWEEAVREAAVEAVPAVEALLEAPEGIEAVVEEEAPEAPEALVLAVDIKAVEAWEGILFGAIYILIIEIIMEEVLLAAQIPLAGREFRLQTLIPETPIEGDEAAQAFWEA